MMRPPARIASGGGRLSLENLTPQPGVVLDEVIITAGALSYDAGTSEVTIEAGEALVRISERNVLLLLQSHAPGLSDLQVTLADGEVRATGRYRLLIANIPFEVIGVIVVDGTRLLFQLLRASPAQGMIAAQLEKLNPLFDVADLRLPVTITLDRVVIENGWLSIYGTIE